MIELGQPLKGQESGPHRGAPQRGKEDPMKPFQALFSGHRSLSLAGLLFASGLLAVTSANPATWLQSSFEAAINGSTENQNVADARHTWTPTIAGSEDYWLGTSNATTDKNMIQPATWQSPVAKGDRFKISSGAEAHEFKVISIEPLLTALNPTTAGDGTTTHEQLLVICHSTDKTHPEVIKFVVDGSSGLPWMKPPARTAHAL